MTVCFELILASLEETNVYKIGMITSTVMAWFENNLEPNVVQKVARISHMSFQSSEKRQFLRTFFCSFSTASVKEAVPVHKYDKIQIFTL